MAKSYSKSRERQDWVVRIRLHSNGRSHIHTGADLIGNHFLGPSSVDLSSPDLQPTLSYSHHLQYGPLTCLKYPFSFTVSNAPSIVISSVFLMLPSMAFLSE